MKYTKPLILFVANLLLVGCSSQPSNTESSGVENSTGETNVSEKITVDAYVSEVSNTSPILVSGQFQGEDVDYVVSSEPVIQSVLSKNPKLSIYQNVGEEFGKKYQTNGFPQAGLFVKSSLLTERREEVLSFLKTFDHDVLDLKEGGKEAVSFLNAYSEDLQAQVERFGYNANVLSAVQKNNGLAFLPKDKQPGMDEIETYATILGTDFQEEDFSSLYFEDVPSETTMQETLGFSVITPKGAPSAVFSRYGNEKELLDFASPSQVSATFTKQDKDFIVFDSVNGVKLSRKNQSSYQLVRMVTFGNLFIVSTGNDEDGTMDAEDMIVSYGENLVPDLAFKAVYCQ